VRKYMLLENTSVNFIILLKVLTLLNDILRSMF